MSCAAPVGHPMSDALLHVNMCVLISGE